MKISKMTLSNLRWQNRKDCTNQSTNNGDTADKAERPVSEGVCL